MTTHAPSVLAGPLTPGGAGGSSIGIPNPLSAGTNAVTGFVVKGVTDAINSFFAGLVKDALNPLLKLLGQTLLTTPSLSTLPRVGQLWGNSRDIAVAVYVLITLVAGIVVMAHETVQTRYGIKEILPRLVTAFVTANLSLLVAGQAIAFANAISGAVLAPGVGSKAAASTLTALVLNAVAGSNIFLIFIGLALAAILLALLVGYVIRVALTVILIAGAPLALMCHALPQTEAVARWWWRAFAGVLAIQLCQSLTLVTALSVFLTPGGFTIFGPTPSGLVDLIVTTALLYILFKIPFWVLHHVQFGGGRSITGTALRGLVAYKTFGGRSAAGGVRPGALAGGSGGGRPGGPPPAIGMSGPRRSGPPGSPARSAGAHAAAVHRPSAAQPAAPHQQLVAAFTAPGPQNAAPLRGPAPSHHTPNRPPLRAYQRAAGQHPSLATGRRPGSRPMGEGVAL